MRSKHLLLIPMLLIASSTSYSDPTSQPTRARLAKGDKAPFAGVLLTDAALAKLITDLEQRAAEARLQLEKVKREQQATIEAERALCAIKLDGAAMKLTVTAKGFESERQIFTGALKKCDSDAPWYRSPYLHNVIGCAACGGICAAAFAASSR